MGRFWGRGSSDDQGERRKRRGVGTQQTKGASGWPGGDRWGEVVRFRAVKRNKWPDGRGYQDRKRRGPCEPARRIRPLLVRIGHVMAS